MFGPRAQCLATALLVVVALPHDTPAQSGGASGSGSGASSPGQAAPSTMEDRRDPGVQACMGYWDTRTHMTKSQWAAICRRTQNRLSNLKSEFEAMAQKSGRDTASLKRERRKPASRGRVSGAKMR